MIDIFGFILGLAALFIAGALAYICVRHVLRSLVAEEAPRHGWVYFPLALLFTIISFRAAMFCLDLINIYFVSNIIVFD